MKIDIQPMLDAINATGEYREERRVIKDRKLPKRFEVYEIINGLEVLSMTVPYEMDPKETALRKALIYH